MEFKYEDLEFEILDDEKFVKIRYNNMILEIETPMLRCPFGIKVFEDTNKRYSFSLSFDKMDINERNKKFYQFIKDLENYIYKYIKNNRNMYYQDIKKKISRSFSSKIVEKNGYAPLLNLNIKNTTKIYLNNEETTCQDLIIRKSSNFYTTCEIICNGIWISSNKFGVSWEVTKISIEDIKNDNSEIIKFSF